jgi:hypothetical protein
LNDKLRPNFSHVFNGIVWNSIASCDDHLIILEVRNLEEKRVTFSALEYKTNTFLWRDRALEESWWVNASAIRDGIILFTIYLDTNNPDKKGVLAYSCSDLTLVWWNNDFAISHFVPGGVTGFTSRTGLKEVTLSIASGRPVPQHATAEPFVDSSLKKPVQYVEGTEYFDTVRTFLSNQLNLQADSALEYLETDRFIFVSFYSKSGNAASLANFLLVLSLGGDVLLRETIGEEVTGIGLDTFFLLEDFLFFVKNKSELVSYRIL